MRIAGENPAPGQEVDVTGWDTVPSLVAQGLLQEVPETASVDEPLYEGFPHESDLKAAGFRTVQAVAALTPEQLEELPGIGEVGVKKVKLGLLKTALFRTLLTPEQIQVLEDAAEEDAAEPAAPVKTKKPSSASA